MNLLPAYSRLPPWMRCPQVARSWRRLDRRRATLALKRAFDLVGAAYLIPLTLPVVGAAALAIRLTSPGPVLFRQRRVTAGGQLFTIYKLRTMAMGSRPWMLSALLVPAGITCPASLCCRKEVEVLALGDRETLYLEEILPAKMAYNCQYVENLSVKGDIRILLRTARMVLFPR